MGFLGGGYYLYAIAGEVVLALFLCANLGGARGFDTDCVKGVVGSGSEETAQWRGGGGDAAFLLATATAGVAVAVAATHLQMKFPITRHAEISAKAIIIKRTLLIFVIIVIGELGIKDFVSLGIQIGNRKGARLLGKEAVVVLSQEMIVLVFIDNEGDLGCAGRTLEFKCRRSDGIIIPHDTPYHIRTCLGICFVESGIAANGSWLMKGGVAVGILLTIAYLIIINGVHCVAETIMSELNFFPIVPFGWLIRRFIAAERSSSWACGHVFGAEGFAFERTGGTATDTLATRS
jgi:hypothetical protein